MKKISSLFLLLLLLSATVQAQSGASAGATNSARQKLKEYVQALQQTPDNNELRQKIVKLAATLKPLPVIPEEARRYYMKAVAIQKNAKTPEEAALAVSAYQQALLLAPWWADAYYNMSSALELAGRYPEAISALKLYLASNPKDARAVQDRIYGIEGEQERATAEGSARAQNEAKEKAQQQAAQQRRQKAEADEQTRQQAELQRQKMQHFLEYLHSKTWSGSQSLCDRGLMCPATQLGVRELQLPGNGRVEIAINEPYLQRLVGTPRGPSLEEISWQCAWNNGQMTPAFSQVFNGGRDFLVSCDDNGDGSQHHYFHFNHW